MSSSTGRFCVPFIIYLIVLLGLVYAFHIELFVTGLRLYVTIANDPRAEDLLGSYYEKNARLSDELSTNFYMSAMQKYKANLSNANGMKQASIKLKIGELYLCGKGVPSSQTQAKRWFDEALQAANIVKGDEVKRQELVSKIQQAIGYSESKVANSKSLPPCQPQTEIEFIKRTFSPLY